MTIQLKETAVTYKGLKVLEASAKLPKTKNAGYNSFIFTEEVSFDTDFNFEVTYNYKNSDAKKYKEELIYIKFKSSYRLVSIVKNHFTGIHIKL